MLLHYLGRPVFFPYDTYKEILDDYGKDKDAKWVVSAYFFDTDEHKEFITHLERKLPILFTWEDLSFDICDNEAIESFGDLLLTCEEAFHKLILVQGKYRDCDSYVIKDKRFLSEGDPIRIEPHLITRICGRLEKFTVSFKESTTFLIFENGHVKIDWPRYD